MQRGVELTMCRITDRWLDEGRTRLEVLQANIAGWLVIVPCRRVAARRPPSEIEKQQRRSGSQPGSHETAPRDMRARTRRGQAGSLSRMKGRIVLLSLDCVELVQRARPCWLSGGACSRLLF